MPSLDNGFLRCPARKIIARYQVSLRSRPKPRDIQSPNKSKRLLRKPSLFLPPLPVFSFATVPPFPIVAVTMTRSTSLVVAVVFVPFIVIAVRL